MNPSSRSKANNASRLGMREIASRVGVSPITVSRALKDPGKVSPETRQKILDAIERAGFIPNQVASSMRGAGRIIGTMVPPLINSGIAEQVQGMSDEMHDSGYQLLLIQGDFNTAAEEKAIRALLGWRPAGLILQAFVQGSIARQILAASNIPVVEISEKLLHLLEIRRLNLGRAPTDLSRAPTEAVSRRSASGCDQGSSGSTVAASSAKRASTRS